MATVPSHPPGIVHPPLSASAPADPGLDAAYRYCRRLTRHASKSFALAAMLLPPPKRRAIEALYAFARTTDDVVDEQREPVAALEAWIGRVHDASVPDSPLLLAWHDTCAHYRLPRLLVDELLAGVAMDLSIARYETWAELELYCYRVASVVGLLVMHVVGHAAGADSYAIQLGIALQLTNILRDVGEDARRGRIYLPLEDLERFGVREEEILSGMPSERFRRLMQWELERAERLYQASWPGIALLHRDGQMAVAAAALLYRGIMPEIVANDFDVWTRRACVSLSGKLLMLPRIRLRVAALRRGDARLPPLQWPAGFMVGAGLHH